MPKILSFRDELKINSISTYFCVNFALIYSIARVRVITAIDRQPFLPTKELGIQILATAAIVGAATFSTGLIEICLRKYSDLNQKTRRLAYQGYSFAILSVAIIALRSLGYIGNKETVFFAFLNTALSLKNLLTQIHRP